MPSITSEHLLNTAIMVARTTGEYAMTQLYRRAETLRIDDHDIKLALDIEMQQRATDAIHTVFPGHSILGEEGCWDRDPAQPRWIVDPIDGTVNFSHGHPIWCVSVAVEHRGETLAAAVFAPEMDELYTTTNAEQARMNDEILAVSRIDQLSAAMIHMGMNRESRDFQAGIRLYGNLVRAAQKVRIMGSAAMDICRVARGHAEGYANMGIYPWDTAAAALILKQAGGQCEVVEQLPHKRCRVVASNGLLHESLKSIFAASLDEPSLPECG